MSPWQGAKKNSPPFTLVENVSEPVVYIFMLAADEFAAPSFREGRNTGGMKIAIKKMSTETEKMLKLEKLLGRVF